MSDSDHPIIPENEGACSPQVKQGLQLSGMALGGAVGGVAGFSVGVVTAPVGAAVGAVSGGVIGLGGAMLDKDGSRLKTAAWAAGGAVTGAVVGLVAEPVATTVMGAVVGGTVGRIGGGLVADGLCYMEKSGLLPTPHTPTAQGPVVKPHRS